MVKVTLRGNFRRIDPSKNAIIPLDAGKRVLPTFAESGSRKVASGGDNRLEHAILLGSQIVSRGSLAAAAAALAAYGNRSSYQTVEFSVAATYPHRRHLAAKVRVFIDALVTLFAHQEWFTANS